MYLLWEMNIPLQALIPGSSSRLTSTHLPAFSFHPPPSLGTAEITHYIQVPEHKMLFHNPVPFYTRYFPKTSFKVAWSRDRSLTFPQRTHSPLCFFSLSFQCEVGKTHKVVQKTTQRTLGIYQSYTVPYFQDFKNLNILDRAEAPLGLAAAT